MQQQPEDSGGGDHIRFVDLEAPQYGQGAHRDSGGRPVEYGLAGKDHDGPGERTGGGSSGACDKRLDLPVVAVAQEPPAGHDHREVDRDEDRHGGHDGTSEPRHEVTDEACRNDDRSGGDHAHRDGIKELRLGQPVMLIDNALTQEGHDRQAASEYERPRLCDKTKKTRYRASRGNTVSASQRANKWNCHSVGARSEWR